MSQSSAIEETKCDSGYAERAVLWAWGWFENGRGGGILCGAGAILRFFDSFLPEFLGILQIMPNFVA